MSGAAAPSASGRSALDRWTLGTVVLAIACAGAYLAVVPRTYDLAAAEFRSELFGLEGFGVWNNLWYAGHHTPGYSVLAPPVGYLLGPPLALAAACVAIAVLFERVARAHFGAAPARWGALWMAAGAASQAWASRLPFALGCALALAAIALTQRGRRTGGLAAALVTGLASPVAAAFLALGALAHSLAGSGRSARTTGALLAGAAAGPPAVLFAAFPQGGYAEFPFSAFFPIPLFCAACLVLLGPEQRTLRAAAVLYALAGTAAFALETPVGGNAVRLGALFGGPLLLCAVWGRPLAPVARGVTAVVLIGLAAWQWIAPLRDVRAAVGEPTAEKGYFEPLNRFLASAPGPVRVEVPLTRSRWENAEVSPPFALARGWERQLDTRFNALFYDGTIDERSYEDWLRANGVSHVALPGGETDPAGRDERALVRGGLPYLRLVRRDGNWTIYAVSPKPGLADPSGSARIRVTALGPDSVQLAVARPGSALLRVRWTPYWFARGACVEPAGGWTRVTAGRTGPLRLTIRVSPERLVSRGRRCDDG